jgi:hypothetical protein
VRLPAEVFDPCTEMSVKLDTKGCICVHQHFYSGAPDPP